MENNTLKRYYAMFDEFPFLLKTLSYGNPDYKMLMEIAINRREKLSEEEIGEYFNNTYDIITSTKKEQTMVKEEKVKNLLKQYGARDVEIENFMEDLANMVDDVKEEAPANKEDDINYLTKEVFDKLKETEEGKDIIMKAPEMSKEELVKLVKAYLSRG